MTKKTIFLFFFLCVSLFYNTKKTTRIDWDVFGYYLYLPATFIYDDLQLEKKEVWLTPLIAKYKTTDGFYQAYKGPQDKYVMKYTMGLCYVYAPFFFIANTIAPMLGYEKDGFSPPYQWMMLIGSLLFSLIGIYYVFRILSNYFSDTIVLVAISFIVFGSNYFVMTAVDGLMPHNFVFTFYAIMLFYTLKWYEEQKIKYALIIGFCVGISVLIRPTSIVVLIIPTLWNIGTFAALKGRILLFWKNYFHVFILGMVAFLVLLPQFVYWKSVTGEWLYYSYPDEKINLFTPHIVNVLFSYKKGWLLYTPLMIFGITGFFHLFKKHRALFFPVFIFFLVNTYLISCWDCWWYGGSFAQRPFVESYVFMLFPLAAIISSLSVKKIVIAAPFFLIGLFILYLNLFQTQQALSGVIHTSLTTEEYYWRVFLKKEASDDDKRWLEPSQYADGKDVFDSNANNKLYGSSLMLNDGLAQLNSENAFSKPLIIPSGLGYDKKNHYLLTTIIVDTMQANTSSDVFGHLVICINKNGKLYEYRSHDFSYQDLISNAGKVELSVLIPPQANKTNYEIKSYTYIDSNQKMKLLSQNNTVWVAP
jgi:Dolichyl-phosphate-mannose-protein mannosyltransferase